MTAIARSDFRDAVATLLAQQSASTPALLRRNDRLGPSSMGADKPVSWQGEIADDLGYTIGGASRTMTMQVQVATTYPTDIAPDDFDDLMDALILLFRANPGAVSATSDLLLRRVEPSPYSIPKADGSSATYRGALLTVELNLWENRV